MPEINIEGLSGFLAEPEPGSNAGVLLLPSHFGMNDLARGQAASLAQAGLITVIWNQYAGREAIVPSHEQAVRWGAELHDETALGQAATWLGWMQSELRLQHVGAIGFCQGGRFALLLAARERSLSACVSYYPTITSPRKPNQDLEVVPIVSEIACPVQLIYPGRDHVTSRATFGALRTNLEGRRAATIVHVYPDADHGFLTTAAEPNNAPAAQLSWPQAIAFLQAALGVRVRTPAAA